MPKIVEVRNSTAEFLTFVAANKEDGVQVVYKDETIWATQAAMGELFGCSRGSSQMERQLLRITLQLHRMAIKLNRLTGEREL